MFNLIASGLLNSPMIQVLWTIGVKVLLIICLTGIAITHHENQE